MTSPNLLHGPQAPAPVVDRPGLGAPAGPYAAQPHRLRAPAVGDVTACRRLLAPGSSELRLAAAREAGRAARDAGVLRSPCRATRLAPRASPDWAVREAITEGAAADVADHWRRLGDGRLVRAIVRRVNLVAAALRDGPSRDHPVVGRMRAAVDRPMSVAAAVEACGGGDAAFHALVRLVADGDLRMREGWSIAYEKTIEPVPDEARDGA